MTTNDRVLVVGASLAGLRAAEALRREGHAGPLTLVGAEAHRPYDRPPLSKRVLTGDAEATDSFLPVDDALDATWRLGSPATGLDLDGRVVALADGTEVGFDRLVIATGAHARPLPGLPALDGVHLLRTLDDAVALREDLVPGRRLVVIGAGFIGLEVAASAVAAGLAVTVVEAAPLPLGRAVSADIGAIVAAWHESHGVTVRLATAVTGLAGGPRVSGVEVTDPSGRAETVPADVVVVGVGAAPSTAWLEGSGVDLDDGVCTDSRLRVLAGGQALPHVVAAGDVVRRHDPATGAGVRAEHWTSAVDQGAAAAAALTHGDAAPVHDPVPYFWSDQYDRKIQMVGRVAEGDEAVVVDGSTDEHRFVVAYGRAGRLVAAVGFSRPGKVMGLQRLIAAGATFPP